MDKNLVITLTEEQVEIVKKFIENLNIRISFKAAVEAIFQYGVNTLK